MSNDIDEIDEIDEIAVTDDTDDSSETVETDELTWDESVPVQERLPLDEPVPYRLTPQGRRVVAPGDVPALRVVDGHHTDLDEAEGTARVRARALRRAGAHTLDIADELGADPLHVEAWVADLPVPRDAGRSRRRRMLRVVQEDVQDPSAREESRQRWRDAAEGGRHEAADRLAAEPGLHSGLGIVSGLLEPDPHALVLAGEHLPLLAAAWSWVRATMEVRPAAARVLVRHEPGVAGDRVAHETAAALGIEVSAVSTTRDGGRVGRRPLVRLRVSDPDLAGRVLGWQRALLAEVSDGAG